MAELGEGVDCPKNAIPGELKIKVINACTGKPLEGAEVEAVSKTEKTSTSGEASFSQVTPPTVMVDVFYHAKDADYSKFIIQYPKFLRSLKAISTKSDVVEVKACALTSKTIALEVYKVIDEIVFHRRHIDIGGDDKYGHWWSVFGPNMSFGWWPKYPVGSRENRRSTPPTPPPPLPADAGWVDKAQHKFSTLAYEAAQKLFDMKEGGPGQTFRGVEGELNGATYFQGVAKNGVYRDPHDLMGDKGNEQYSPVIIGCDTIDDFRKKAEAFALSYSGDWSWRLEAGNHCHTFQIALMSHLAFDKFKVIK